MTDINAARIHAHQGNIARYRRILATQLTALERSFVMKRLAEEMANLRRLEATSADTDQIPSSQVAA
jgi:hypothetical protein